MTQLDETITSLKKMESAALGMLEYDQVKVLGATIRLLEAHSALAKLKNNPPPDGTRWQANNSKDRVTVLETVNVGLATNAIKYPPMVLFATDDGGKWARPLSVWYEEFTHLSYGASYARND